MKSLLNISAQNPTFYPTFGRFRMKKSEKITHFEKILASNFLVAYLFISFCVETGRWWARFWTEMIVRLLIYHFEPQKHENKYITRKLESKFLQKGKKFQIFSSRNGQKWNLRLNFDLKCSSDLLSTIFRAETWETCSLRCKFWYFNF
jgi:hypothetical protein